MFLLPFNEALEKAVGMSDVTEISAFGEVTLFFKNIPSNYVFHRSNSKSHHHLPKQESNFVRINLISHCIRPQCVCVWCLCADDIAAHTSGERRITTCGTSHITHTHTVGGGHRNHVLCRRYDSAPPGDTYQYSPPRTLLRCISSMRVGTRGGKCHENVICFTCQLPCLL